MVSRNSRWVGFNQGREDNNQRRLSRDQDLPGYILENAVCKKERAVSGRGKQAVEKDKGTKSKKTLCAIIWNLIL